MGPILFTPETDRAQYHRIVASLAKQLNMSNEQVIAQYKIMPFILKMATYLSPSKSNYSLSPRSGVNNPAISTAQLLDQNDFFAIGNIGLRFGRAAYASGLYSNHGNYPQFTYPDPNYFNGTGTTAGSEAASLQCIVNGTVGLKVSGDFVIENLSAQDLCFNPISTYASSPLAYPQFGGDRSESRGQYPVTPNYIIDAMADNEFTIQLPADGAKGNIDGSISTGTTDSGLRNILYVVAEGWKIKNLAGAGVTCKAGV